MGRLSEEECLLGQAKNWSSINLNNQGNLPGKFSDKDTSQKRTRKKEALRKKETPRKIPKGKLLPLH